MSELSGSVTVNAPVAETFFRFSRSIDLNAIAPQLREIIVRFERSGENETQLTVTLGHESASTAEDTLQIALDEFARMVDEAPERGRLQATSY
jgi:hypothetical protein